MYTYRATLDRLIGPVSMSVVIDLGFRTRATIVVRLDGVDLPENRQAAQQVTADWFAEHPDFIIHTIQDKRQTFGRWFAEITDLDGNSLNQSLLDLGHVQPYQSGALPPAEG
jgi:endonuclease YncB( thermonuclease family)